MAEVSLITAVWNREQTIADAIASAKAQSFADFEHIVVDGASTDGTVCEVRRAGDHRLRLQSEPDEGIYDALNKGIAMASGNVVGLLHSDDLFADKDVLRWIVDAFADPAIDAVYGDLDYVAQHDTERVIRRWRSARFQPSMLKRGWMPPHPTLFVRRAVFEKFGHYDTNYRIAADYDAILRWFGRGAVRSVHIPKVLVKMRTGGESNRSLRKIMQKSAEDYRALRSNRIGGVGTLAWKNLGKAGQFFVK